MNTNLKYQTLHAHTNFSDGFFNHLDVLDTCKKYDIGVVAFTDHDALINSETLKNLKSYKGKVTWISGIEISSGWPIDLGGGVASGVHIVGLFVDPFNKVLLDHCKLAQDARRVRMQKIVNNLHSLGFDITEGDCLRESGGEAVGRPHIARAILKKEKNLIIITELKKKMESAAATNPQTDHLFSEMLKAPEWQHPFYIFLSPDSYIKGIYVDYQYYSDFDNSVKLIRNAGGIALLAHPFTCMDKMNDNYLDNVLKENRLDGIETIFGLGPSGLMNKDEIEDFGLRVTKLVSKYDKLEGGGIDLHKEYELKIFKENLWYKERTINLLEKVLKIAKINTHWSSL